MTNENEEILKIVLIGESSVGKTSIINQFIEKTFQEYLQSTVGGTFNSKLIRCEDLNKTLKLEIWDTAGQERYRSITKTYYSSSQGLVFIYDITKRETFDNLDEWINNAKESLGNENNYLIFLIGNKLDLAEENPDKREVTVEEGESKCKENGIIWGGECSAKNYTEEKFKQIFQNYSELIFQKVGYVSNKGEVVKNNNDEKIKKKSIKII